MRAIKTLLLIPMFSSLVFLMLFTRIVFGADVGRSFIFSILDFWKKKLNRGISKGEKV